MEVVDDLSDMDPEDRAALEAALDESEDDVQNGRLIENEEVLRRLHRVVRGEDPLEPGGR